MVQARTTAEAWRCRALRTTQGAGADEGRAAAEAGAYAAQPGFSSGGPAAALLPALPLPLLWCSKPLPLAPDPGQLTPDPPVTSSGGPFTSTCGLGGDACPHSEAPL